MKRIDKDNENKLKNWCLWTPCHPKCGNASVMILYLPRSRLEVPKTRSLSSMLWYGIVKPIWYGIMELVWYGVVETNLVLNASCILCYVPMFMFLVVGVGGGGVIRRNMIHPGASTLQCCSITKLREKFARSHDRQMNCGSQISEMATDWLPSIKCEMYEKWGAEWKNSFTMVQRRMIMGGVEIVSPYLYTGLLKWVVWHGT